MWTEITRPKYERKGLRYASDVTEAEWALISPHLPAAKPLGRPRETDFRAVVDGLLYMARTGCQWRQLQPCTARQPLALTPANRQSRSRPGKRT
jgi:transposase